jgi:hypothetical protein
MREAGMERHYYAVKALIVAAGIGLAIFSSVFGTPRLDNSMAHIHYGAGASVESRLIQSTVKLSRAIREFVQLHN